MNAITLLDGGMGQELIARAPEPPTPLWATRAMLDHPGLVAAVHRDFAGAGAVLHTANTYAIHRDRLEGTGLEARFADLHAMAMDEAREGAGTGARIAGAVGPLAASYRPERHPDHAAAVPLYAEVARLLAPRCDLLICETIASVAHGRAVLEGASGHGVPVWLAFTVSDTDGARLRSGEPLEAVLELAGGADAVLANCSAPEAMGAALGVLGRAGLPFGAYANGFERITEDFLRDGATVSSLSPRRDVTPALYADHAMAWIEAGATIVGGCCEVGPGHIRAIRGRLDAAGLAVSA